MDEGIHTLSGSVAHTLSVSGGLQVQQASTHSTRAATINRIIDQAINRKLIANYFDDRLFVPVI